MARASATPSTSLPPMAGTTRTSPAESLRRASRAGSSTSARAASRPFLNAVPSTRTTGATAVSPPGSQTRRPSGSSCRPAAKALRAVAAASSLMPNCVSVSPKGSSAPTRELDGLEPGRQVVAHGGGDTRLVQATDIHAGHCDAVGGTPPRERLQRDEAAGDENHDEEQGRRPHVTAVPGAEPAQRTTARRGNGGLPGPGRECVHAFHCTAAFAARTPRPTPRAPG